jgi:hypothetical protein
MMATCWFTILALPSEAFPMSDPDRALPRRRSRRGNSGAGAMREACRKPAAPWLRAARAHPGRRSRPRQERGCASAAFQQRRRADPARGSASQAPARHPSASLRRGRPEPDPARVRVVAGTITQVNMNAPAGFQ